MLTGCPVDSNDGDDDLVGDADSGETNVGEATDATEDDATDTGDDATDTGDGTTAESSCPPSEPYGTEVGDTIDNLVLHRQNGDLVPLHGACGQPQRAFILFGTASW